MDKLLERKLDNKLNRKKASLPEFANEFLRSLENDRALQTQIEYSKDVTLFLEFVSEKLYQERDSVMNLTLFHLESLTEQDMLDFLDYVSSYEREFLSVAGNKTKQRFTNGPLGKARKRNAIKVMYDYFIRRGKLQVNPIAHVKINTDKEKIKPRLSSVEIHALMDVAYNQNPDDFRALRNLVIVKLLAYTGIRIAELTNLNLDSVWPDRHEMVIVRKGGSEGIVYINKNIRADLYRYLKKRKEIENIQKGHKNALFLSQRMRRIDPRSVRKMLRVTAERAEIETSITPHTFRRTFGWKHYNNNKDLELTAKVLGHQSIETTRRHYANADVERLNKSLDDFDY